jgi:hypothetical protein
MKLARRLWTTSSYPATGRAYERMLATPFHHLVTVLLTRAVEQQADAICFGFRPDLIEDNDARVARLKSEETFSNWLAEQRLLHPSFAAVDRSARTLGPDGRTGIPISLRVAGVLRYFGEQPCDSYGMLLGAIQSRLVALGAGESDPQPLRNIEIGYGMSKHPTTSGTQGQRRFVEVDLAFEEDNTFWVHLRGVRETSAGVRISQTIF